MVAHTYTAHSMEKVSKDLLPTEQGEKNNGGRSTLKEEFRSQNLWRRTFPTGYCWELQGTMSLAWALMLTQAGQVLLHPIAVMFAGHLGKLELAAVSLSNMLINVLGNSVVVGFATCLDTTLAQSFGSGNFKMISIFLQRGLILHLLLLMPCCVLYLNIKPILLALGQPEAVVELTSQYLLYFIPGFFFMFMLTAVKKFTQCQNDVFPHTIIAFIGHAVHILLQYLLLYHFKFGVIGSSIAQASTFGVICILTLIYTVCSKSYKLCWDGWSRSCLLEWESLALMGVFGMLMVCLEWWAIEAASLLAGYMGETELAAVYIPFHLQSIFFGLLRGVAKASCIRVAQFLGAARKDAALCAARVGMTVTGTGGVVCAILYISAKSELPKLFTDDATVIQLVSELMPMLAVFAFCDAFAFIGRGIFRGIGRQQLGTVVTFFSYYIVAIPVAVPLTLLTPLSIRGIWIGFSISSFVCATIYLIAINFVLDWDKLVKEALERVNGMTCVADKCGDIESKPLLQGSLKKTGPDSLYIPKSLYIKRVVTIAFFILLPIVGLISRLVTQTGTMTDSPAGNNSTMICINATEVSTVSFTHDQ